MVYDHINCFYCYYHNKHTHRWESVIKHTLFPFLTTLSVYHCMLRNNQFKIDVLRRDQIFWYSYDVAISRSIDFLTTS